ncbi:hypothetical protein Cs7R123_50900 [Catellatospora sp. TT07R-123]|uniref:DUF7019 family protein n=1 Tax=Catellatospora sp. TT07R-123 TaxID=2733863 RepID=UPI001B160A0A|nr:SAVMC3_10250 family protein [Catellatospora sp. TT07R-123]GHJ47748.1 hypothetical protein Cs7R123_50900 [Catellatospora sp. TT07R-123]
MVGFPWWKRPAPQELKHFIYISPPKVDALYYQVDTGALRRAAKALHIDLKVISVEISSVGRPDTTFSRLRVVLEALDRLEQLGTCDAPKSYFRSRMTMRYGSLGGGVMLFAGEEGETRVRLGCSQGHFDLPSELGHPRDLNDALSNRQFGGVSAQVGSHLLGIDAAVRRAGRKSYLIPGLHRAIGRALESYVADDFAGADEAYRLGHFENVVFPHGAVSQPVEFVARRLQHGPSLSGGTVLVGTPLYVALTN